MSFDLDRRVIDCAVRWVLLSWVVVFVASPAAAQDAALAVEQSLTKVIEQSEPAVVSIARLRIPITETIVTTRPFDRPQSLPPTSPDDPDYQPNGYGAGIIVAGAKPTERVVLTNFHVVHGGPVYSKLPERGPPTREVEGVKTQLFVRFADRRTCYASILAADPRSDLAVLALELEKEQIDPADLKTLDWTTSTPAKKGQLVVMLGNPYALSYDGSASAGWGMISNLSRRPLPWTDDMTLKSKMYRLGNLIQIDGRLNLGTSGGPLLNLKGELIGLTTSLAAIEGYEKSAGFAIPMDDLTRPLVKSLIAGHEVEYGVLGIVPQLVTPGEFRDLNTGLKQTSAALADEISFESPAEQAGMKVKDVILSISDIPIHSEYDLMRIVGLKPPDSSVDIMVWRQSLGKTLHLTAKLGKWPVKDEDEIIETVPRYSPWRGISVDYPTGRAKFHNPRDPYRRAVVVTKAEGAAEAAGIQPGRFIAEVNRVPVQTPAEFAAATKSLKGPVELRLIEVNKVEFHKSGDQYVKVVTKVTIGE